MSKRKYLIRGVIFAGLLLVACSVFGKTAQARKPKLDFVTKVDLGKYDKYKITVYNLPDEAKLKFSIDNKSIAKVKKEGNQGVITGIRIGKTKIRAKYVLNGKTHKIGSKTVTVHKARYNKEFSNSIKNKIIRLKGNNGYYTKNPETIEKYVAEELGWGYPLLYSVIDHAVIYDNKRAKYSYSSSDTSKLKISQNGMIKYSKGTGRVTISIIETYKKKRRKIGSFVVELVKPAWKGQTSVKANVGQVYDIFSHTPYVEKQKAVFSGDVTYLENSKNEWNGKVRFNKGEKTTCDLYEYDFEAGDYKSKPFATISFDLSSGATLSAVKVTDERTDNPFSKIESLIKWPEIIDDYEDCGFDGVSDHIFYVYQDSYNYSGGYKITSSDPSIASVSEIMNDEYDNYYDDSGYCGYFVVREHKSGSCVITVEGNGAKTSFVHRSYFSSWVWDYGYTGEFEVCCGNYTSHEKPDESKFRYEIIGDDGLGIKDSKLDVYTSRVENDNPYADPGLWRYGAKLKVCCDESERTGGSYSVAVDGECDLMVYYGDEVIGKVHIYIQR